jgi:hypothetical protein
LAPKVKIAHGYISGTVTDRFAGAGIESIEVQFFSEGVQLGRTLTVADGSYRSPPLPEGVYTVATHGDGLYLHEVWDDHQCWWMPGPAEGHTAVVTADVESAGVDFELELGGRIAGTVTSARTAEGIDRAVVHVGSLIGDLDFEVLTDADGQYGTPALPSGAYVVWIDGRPGRAGRIFGGGTCAAECDLSTAACLVVEAGLERPRVDFTLD